MNNQDKRARGRPKTVKKQETTELAMQIYWEEGIHKYSLNEICRRVKISKPALYREFKNEDGLMEATLIHYRELVILPMLSLRELPLTFSEVLSQAIEILTSERDRPAGCLFTHLRLAKPFLGTATLHRLEEIEKERFIAFQEWYGKALELGQVNPELSPTLAAGYIDTQLNTLLLQMGAGGDPQLIREHAKLAFKVLTIQPAAKL